MVVWVVFFNTVRPLCLKRFSPRDALRNLPVVWEVFMPAVGYKSFLIAARARQERLRSRCWAMVGIGSRGAAHPSGAIETPRDFIIQADAENPVAVRHVRPVDTRARTILSLRSMVSKPMTRIAEPGFAHRDADPNRDKPRQ